MQDSFESLTPLDWLVAASARCNPLMLRMMFALDRKCGRIALAAREPIIGQMRLAWWRDVLRDDTKGKGEPLADALRKDSAFGASRDDLVRVVDGWEEICVAGGNADEWEEAVASFSGLRGSGMFAAIAGVENGRTGGPDRAGAVWALWDLAGQLGEGVRRDIVLGQAEALSANRSPISLPRPLRILALLSERDVQRGRGSPERMTPRLYGRFLRAQFLGR